MHILIPKLLKPKPTQLKTLLWAVHEGREPAAPPTPGLTSLPVLEWRDDRWWLAAGFLRAGRHAFRLDVVQRIAEGARNAEQAARQKPKREDAQPANKPAEPVVETLPPPIEDRSEEHTSELQSLMRTSYAVFCLKKKKKTTQIHNTTQ